MIALALRRLSIHHADRALVGPLDLQLPAGQTLGVRGRSGAGKSTLLRAAVGLLPPGLEVRGELEVLGTAVQSWNRRDPRWAGLRARAALVGQTPVVFAGSVLANAAFGLRHLMRGRRAELRDRACAALVEAGLWDEVADRLDEPAHTLSVGQRQRLCLARALALDPALLLLDEPTSALDNAARDVVEAAVADLVSRRTVVLVSHDAEQVQRLCGRIIDLDGHDIDISRQGCGMTATRGPDEVIRTEIDDYYRDKAAQAEVGTSCCGTDASLQTAFGASQYDEVSTAQVPDKALLASLGCGNPTAVAELAAGETVLDLGSGGGLDVILSAKRVGPTGRAFGVERLAEMRALAERNAAVAEVDNVEFLAGDIENIPLPDGVIDVVISNCVVNLSQDKPTVIAEVFRVLRPGGRVGIADVVADDHLSVAERAERGSTAECIAGALSFAEYREILTEVGFTDVEVTATHKAADGMHGAIVRARRPCPEPVA